MAAKEICEMWWKSFVCLLPKGHEGPHEDWGVWRDIPGKSGKEEIGTTDFYVRWGRGAIPPTKFLKEETSLGVRVT